MTTDDELDIIEERLARVEGAIETILKLLAKPEPSAGFGPTAEYAANESLIAVRRITLKQHATLQMLIEGFTDREIAERLCVHDSTIKMHVRALAKKMGVRGRHNIAALGQRIINSMSDDDYEQLARIPKNWSTTWTASDRKKRSELYTKRLG